MRIDRQLWGFVALLVAAMGILLWPFFTGLTLLPADSLKSLPLSRFGEELFFGSGTIAQWIPMMFGGMPCYGSVMVTPSYLVSDLFTWGLGNVFTVFRDPLAQHAFHLLLLGAGSLFYLRRMGVSRMAALVVSLNLMLMPGLTGLIGAGHTIKLWTVCWMPLVLWLMEGILRRGRLRDIGLAALALGMMLSAKHIQLSWYFLILAGAYTLVRVIQIHRGTPGTAPWLALARMAGFVALGLALAAFLYLPVLEYSGLSLRADGAAGVAEGSYAAAYSYPPGDIASWWIASIKGYGGPTYWGALEYTAFPLYMGALWLVPLVMALVRRPGLRLVAWLLPALVLLVLGLGEHSPLFGLLVDHLPYYAKFRAHMWALAPAQMLLLFASADGWDLLLAPAGGPIRDTGGPVPLLRREWPLAAAGGLLLLALLATSLKPATPAAMGPGDSWSSPQDGPRLEVAFARQNLQPNPQQFQGELQRMRHERAMMGYGSLARTLALAGAGLLLVGLYRRSTLNGVTLALGLAFLVVLDCVPEARKVMDFSPRRPVENHFRAQGVMGALAQLPDKHLFRIWPKDGYPYNEAVWHGLHSIDGYHGAKLGVVQRMFTEASVSTATPGITSLHPVMLDLLNVQYVISHYPIEGLNPVARAEDGVLLENPDALPRIFFPTELREVSGEGAVGCAACAGFRPAGQRCWWMNPPAEPDVRMGPSPRRRLSGELSTTPERIVYSHSRTGLRRWHCLSEIWVAQGLAGLAGWPAGADPAGEPPLCGRWPVAPGRQSTSWCWSMHAPGLAYRCVAESAWPPWWVPLGLIFLPAKRVESDRVTYEPMDTLEA
jgi:hypothetical protein